jgi:MFS transporter, DHA1 family, staphyloferrin A biosynthesis exporter
MFSALRYRNYRFYWIGQFPSVLAQNMQHVALAWLVYQLTSSPALLGIAGLVQTAPQILLSPVGGAMADRMDRRRMLIATQGASALFFFGLGTLVAADLAGIWQVLGLAFLLGCVRAFDQPARQAILPLAVPREEIANAVPLGNLVWNTTRLVGPAAAGMLILLIGVGHTFYVASASFVVATLLFAQLRLPASAASGPGRGLFRNMLDGIIYIRRNQIISALIGLVFFNSVFGMSYTIMLPVFARDIFDVGPQGFGMLELAGGLGSVLGTFGVAAFSRSRGNGWRILGGGAVFGLLIVAFAYTPSFGLSMGLLFLMGAANQVYMTAANTTLQLSLPNEFRGRVMSVWGLTWSLMPLGGTISGGIAEYAGAPAALAIGGALVAVMALVVAVTMPRVRQL